MVSKDFEFKDILSHITTLYHLGVLVPFIGSGMSRPTLTGWQDFLINLAKEAKVSENLVQDPSKMNASMMYRLADTTVRALLPLPYDERANKYRKALRGQNNESNEIEIPPQTQALASLAWPLVLTTNYDDLYWYACASSERPSIHGRSLEDCHNVLRSLDEISPPILWALQGFLGGQAERPDKIIKNPAQLRELANQVVVGHQQYQIAINTDSHFRRAFAEIFRRRSLLFLGSGLLEDYLVNLFSETRYHYGPGRYPHFALIDKEKKSEYDSSFLQIRLGIVPVFYEDRRNIPRYLQSLHNSVDRSSIKESISTQAPVSTVESDGIRLNISPLIGDSTTPLGLCIYKSPLPTPQDTECAVVSVGRRPVINTPRGEEVNNYLFRLKTAGVIKEALYSNWISLEDPPSYVYRYSESPVFAIAARSKTEAGKRHDLRDIGVIPDAVCATLEMVDNAGFKVVHMGAIASSKKSPWHPVHPFVQTLRGIKIFMAKRKISHIELINLYIVDVKVWSLLSAGKIPVPELLSSDLMTYRLNLTDSEGKKESFVVTLSEPPKLIELLKEYNIKRDDWDVEVFPPLREEQETTDALDDMILTPTMTVNLTPKSGRKRTISGTRQT